MKIATDEKEYFKGIDIIRVLSCILVLLYHLNILQGGFLAVCTFFALSGYLVCTSALKHKKFSIKKYYFNRLKNIYLPLVIVTFITVIIFKLIPSINWMNMKPETASVLFGYNNFWQLNANLDYFTRHVNSPFMHFWYISILMQFDLIFPILFVTIKKINKKIKSFSILFTTILTISLTLFFIYMSNTQNIMVVYYNTLARCFSIVFGILVALIQYKYKIMIPNKFKHKKELVFLLYIIALILLSIFVSSNSNIYWLFMIITTIITCRLISYSTIEKSNRKETNKLLKFFAKISYEIYLVQYPIIFFLSFTNMHNILKILITIILTFLISCILHLLLNFKFKNKTSIIIKFFLIVITIIGSILVIVEKDHTDEMKELEKKLDENSNITENKNNEYLNSMQQELIETSNQIDVKTYVDNLPVVGIGDSVLLGVADELYAKFPNGYFDGKVSRNLTAGMEILESLINDGKLGNTVLLALANNGDYSTTKNQKLMELLGDRQIFWVDAMGADDPQFNEKFAEFAKYYPNLHIIEWEKIAKDHPEYIYADGVHIKGDGIQAYADMVYDSIYEFYSKNESSIK